MNATIPLPSDPEKAKAFIKFLEDGLFEYEVIRKEVTIKNVNDITLFEIGREYGENSERQVWEQPEEFYLPDKYSTMLNEAMNEYSKESGILIDSIFIEDKGTQSKITVSPTKAIHLFNIFSRYGKKVQAQKQKI